MKTAENKLWQTLTVCRSTFDTDVSCVLIRLLWSLTIDERVSVDFFPKRKTCIHEARNCFTQPGTHPLQQSSSIDQVTCVVL